ncbi:hypothetical protein AB0C81_19090 [Streptomyces roseoverticillatus]|uniref:hypothetical protein n=1 Tax=Streptomyces roseoverticillatus TaxID=66429 RepID=UPI0033D30DB0
MTGISSSHLARLPILVSPRLGEGSDSYIRRLAHANHLRPSYLHGFLAGPPLWFGKPRLDRLTALTGRSPETLERALADASSPSGRSKPNPRNLSRNLFPDRRELLVLIPVDARDGTMTIRALAKRHQVPQWAVRLVLDTAHPLARDISVGAPPVMGPLAELVDEMIARGLRGRAIWAELMDEHSHSVSYSSLLSYLRNSRLARQGRN